MSRGEAIERKTDPVTKVLICPSCGADKLVNVSAVVLPDKVKCQDCGTEYSTQD